MKRSEKETMVGHLVEEAGRSQAVMLVNPIGLTVEQATALRDGLKRTDSRMVVAKNTLLRRAGEGTDLGALAGMLAGPNAVVFSYGDPVACAKVLIEYAKENPELEIKAGVLSGKLMDRAKVEALAKLPARDVLLSQIAGAMQLTVSGLARGMAALLAGFPNAIKALISKQETAA